MMLALWSWLAILCGMVYLTVMAFCLFPDWNCDPERRTLWYYIWVWDMAYNVIAAAVNICALDILFYRNLVDNWSWKMRCKIYIPNFVVTIGVTILLKLAMLNLGLFNAAWTWVCCRLVVIVGVVGGFLLHIPFILHYNHNSEQRALLLWNLARYFWYCVWSLVMYYACQLYVFGYKYTKHQLLSGLNLNTYAVSAFDLCSSVAFGDMVVPLFAIGFHKIVGPLCSLALPIEKERILIIVNIQVSSFKVVFGRNVFDGISNIWILTLMILKEELSVVISFGIKYSPEHLISRITNTAGGCCHAAFLLMDDTVHLWRSICKFRGFQRKLTNDIASPASHLHHVCSGATHARSHHEQTGVNTGYTKVHVNDETVIFEVGHQLSRLHRKATKALREAEPLDAHFALRRAEAVVKAQQEVELFDEDRLDKADEMALSYGFESMSCQAPKKAEKTLTESGVSTKGSEESEAKELLESKALELLESEANEPFVRQSSEEDQALELVEIVERLHAAGVPLPDHGHAGAEELAEEALDLRNGVAYMQRCLKLHWLGMSLPLMSSSFVGFSRLMLKRYFPCTLTSFHEHRIANFFSLYEWSLLLLLNSITTVGLLLIFVHRRMRLPHDALYVFVQHVLSDLVFMAACFCWCAHISMDEVLTEYVMRF